MITGVLMFDVEIECKDEATLQELSRAICTVVKQQTGVSSCEEVDSNVEDDSDEADAVE